MNTSNPTLMPRQKETRLKCSNEKDLEKLGMDRMTLLTVVAEGKNL